MAPIIYEKVFSNRYTIIISQPLNLRNVATRAAEIAFETRLLI